MKKFIYSFIFIFILYFLTFYFISIYFGLPPYNFGFTIGYPTIYYQFDTRNHTHHGFMGLLNIFFNIIIIVFLSLIYLKITSLYKRKKY